MKKEELLIDTLLKEHHEKGADSDSAFIDSVLHEIDPAHGTQHMPSAHKVNAWPRYAAASVAVLAVTGIGWYVATQNPQIDQSVAIHEAQTETLYEEETQPSFPPIASKAKKDHDAITRKVTKSSEKFDSSSLSSQLSVNADGPHLADHMEKFKESKNLTREILSLKKESSPGALSSGKPEIQILGREDAFAHRSNFGDTGKKRERQLSKQIPFPITEQDHGDRYSNLTDNEPTLTSKNPISTFSVDVDTASYSQLRRSLNAGVKPHPNSVRIEEMINYFSYDYAQPTDMHPFSIHVEQSSCPWNTEHHLVKIGLQGKKVDNADRKPANLVFLIDTSGSMAAPDKLPLLQSALTKLVKTMNEKDTLSIVTYAGNSGIALSPTKLTDQNKLRIASVLQDMAPKGSTNGASGLQLAYDLATENQTEEGISRIILATDGDFNVGISNSSHLTELVKEKAKKGVEISVLGFGRGNLNDKMLESITNHGNGNYSYIDTDAEAYRVLVKNIGGTLQTIAKDVKIQAIFKEDSVASYRLIGYANRKLETEDFANDKVDAGEIGAGHSVTAIYQVELTEGIEENASLMDIKLRYKQPKGTESSLITKHVNQNFIPIENASQDMQFTSSLALFGMILRDSKWTADGNRQMVLKLAKQGISDTDKEAKQEFLKLISPSVNKLGNW